MTTYKIEKLPIYLAILAVLVLVTGSAYATTEKVQGDSGGNTNGSQVGAVEVKEQDREQSNSQDGNTATPGKLEADKTRLQTEDQDQAGVIYDDHEQIQLRDQDRTQTQVSTPEELREIITKTRNQVQTEAQTLGAAQRNIYQNQNQVRVAATALASSSNLLGSLGPAVTRIANNYQESVSATIQVEERIQTRSRIKNFLFGGDTEAAAELEQHIREQKEQTESLGRLLEAWEGDSEIKQVLQEQVQAVEQEQMRLQKLADEERSSRGLFDYLFFWRN